MAIQKTFSQEFLRDLVRNSQKLFGIVGKRNRLSRESKQDIIVFITIATVVFSSTVYDYKTHKGNVIKKEFIPAHTGNVTKIVSDGVIWFPQTNTYYYPDKHQVTITSDVGIMDITTDFGVTEEEYEKIKIGDYLKFNQAEQLVEINRKYKNNK